MVFEPVLLTPSELDVILDPDNPEYGFAFENWVESPPYVAPEGEEIDLFYRRLANASAYQQHGSPVSWNRYITLGYYAYDDCNEFDAYWRQFTGKQTFCMKMVWYNFMYHVDRKMDIPSKLQTWATEVARPHLSQLDPSFLRIDTLKLTWKQILNNSVNTDENVKDNRPWTLVDSPRSTSQKAKRNPSAPSISVTSRIKSTVSRPNSVSGSTKLTSLRSAVPSPAGTTPNKKSITHPKNQNHIQGNQGVTFANDPSYREEVLHKITTEEPTATENVWTRLKPKQTADSDSEMSDSKPSANTSFNVVRNDGTHRLTFRWKPSDSYNHLSGNPVEWLSVFLEILNALFCDRDGSFYRWESEDLTQSCPVSKLTVHDLRDYISPSITSIDNLSTFVFGARFRFADQTPLIWRNHEVTKQVLKDHGINLTVSNSTCSSGQLVIAGYILFKAPNTTHRVRYMQSIRNNIPTTAPFFDILLFKRTPTDDNYHHLAVQCGENHVGPLTSALSAYLTGKGHAFFLPRLAFAKLTTDQIKKYFDMHQSYVRSLRPIKISPAINNLDVLRLEKFPNGTVVERTTREWATSMTLKDGKTSARCDVVNGSSDKQTYLLVPKQNFHEVSIAVREYRFRLNILGQRETRFRDGLPGLPSEIHIDLSTQANLTFIEQMSKDEDWSMSSEYTRKPAPHSRPQAEGPTGLDSCSEMAENETLWPPPADNLNRRDRATTSNFPVTLDSNSKASRNPQSDEQSTRSAESISLATVMAPLDAFDKALQSQQHVLEQFTSVSNEKFKNVEDRFSRLDKLDDMILERMTQHQSESLTAIKTQFDGLMAHMLSSFQAGNIAPSPPARRPHSSTIEQVTNDLLQVGEFSMATSSQQVSINLDSQKAPRSSMSTASGSSGGSSIVQSPRTKRSRSIHNDMEQLSLQPDNNSDSELSALGNIEHDPDLLEDSFHLTETSDTSPQHVPTLYSNVAQTDPNAPYKSQRDSDGGAQK